ncbi:carbon storage regulator [Zhongshania borealis]|uniref:Translational regulator CsrA n=1 Tax=Zhongshania borealis TaxID=889488 RepID=A0ABP7WR95_9GAMM
MLSITRKEGQSFYIGDEITVTVKRARSGNAVIRINAPREISIMRSELSAVSPDGIPLPDVEFMTDEY